MKAYVELFPFALENDTVYYNRRTEDISGTSRNPDTVVQSLLVSLGFTSADQESVAFVHSTSWRYEEEGMVVLTYLAYCRLTPPDPRIPMTVHCMETECALQSDPLNPRPQEIQELHVLSHGLRHLSFLVSQSDTDYYEDLIGKDACMALRVFQPETAGQFRS